jgi:hypothetical protein
MLNAPTNVRFWGQNGQLPTAAYRSRFMSTRPNSTLLPPVGLTVGTMAQCRKMAGVWFAETADLRRDFWKAFGHVPGKLVAVAISSDWDDTGGLNIAAVADLEVN